MKMSKEKLSALMDGELDPHELDDLLKSLREDDALLQSWHDWRLASDVLEGCPSCSPDFMRRFSEKLAAEPIVVAPRSMRHRKAIPVGRILMPLTVAASVAFVGLAVLRVNTVDQSSAVQIARETESTLRSYLAAHRESDGNPFADREVIRANFQFVETH